MSIISEEINVIFSVKTHGEPDHHVIVDDIVYLHIKCLWLNLIGHVLKVHITTSPNSR